MSQMKSFATTQDSLIYNEFKFEYKKTKYQKFINKIIVNKNCYSFENQVVCSNGTNEINLLISSGILNPKLFTQYHIDKFFNDNPKINKSEFISKFKNELKTFEKDSIGISNLRHLDFFKLNYTTKRFSFWYHDGVFASPLLYLIELQNKNATKNMSLLNFIKGAELTFIIEEWFE